MTEAVTQEFTELTMFTHFYSTDFSFKLWSCEVLPVVNYLPQQKLREGNVFTGVCLSTDGGCIPACNWAWGDVCPGACLIGGCLPEGDVYQGVSAYGVYHTPWADTPNEADGWHPTRMHSCLLQILAWVWVSGHSHCTILKHPVLWTT